MVSGELTERITNIMQHIRFAVLSNLFKESFVIYLRLLRETGALITLGLNKRLPDN